MVRENTTGRPQLDHRSRVTLRQGLIAVNYPARDCGIGRFTDINEARKLCDNLICQHVATWREGEDNWAYRDKPMIDTDKVSLDP